MLKNRSFFNYTIIVMKQKILISSVLVALSIMCIPLLTSCDDDGPNPDDAKVDKVKVDYEVDFPDVVFQFCDVSIEYTDNEGKQKTAVITRDTEFEFTVPANYAHRRYTLSATIMLKKNHPAIDNNRYYDVGENLEIELSEYNAAGNELRFNVNQNKTETRVKGSDLLTYLGNMSMSEHFVSMKYPF